MSRKEPAKGKPVLRSTILLNASSARFRQSAPRFLCPPREGFPFRPLGLSTRNVADPYSSYVTTKPPGPFSPRAGRPAGIIVQPPWIYNISHLIDWSEGGIERGTEAACPLREEGLIGMAAAPMEHHARRRRRDSDRDSAQLHPQGLGLHLGEIGAGQVSPVCAGPATWGA